MSRNYTALDIEEALRKRYPSDAYAVLSQVANGTGARATRTADALVFGLWPSRGLDIEGIEIKVSRSDWRKELEDVGKASAFSVYCHRWWVAAVPGVVETGELPPKWGLLELKRGVLRQASEAPREPSPKPIPHSMWAAVMRNVQKSELAAVERRRREIEAEAKSRAGERYDQLIERVEKFKEATGVDVRYSYDADHIGQALALVQEGKDFRHVTQKLKWLKESLVDVADKIDALDGRVSGEGET